MPVKTVFITTDGEKFDDLKTAEIYEHISTDSAVPYMPSFNRRTMAAWLVANYTLVRNVRNENGLSFEASN